MKLLIPWPTVRWRLPRRDDGKAFVGWIHCCIKPNDLTGGEVQLDRGLARVASKYLRSGGVACLSRAGDVVHSHRPLTRKYIYRSWWIERWFVGRPIVNSEDLNGADSGYGTAWIAVLRETGTNKCQFGSWAVRLWVSVLRSERCATAS